ncbi:UDP-3-O-acyl-N-acetylglucosamine deacetylase [Candidatus Bandiella numerosa]|uniref:UDP-3-O-acyl-N-acetylglucosamine deacetylase n=1 Tax=Candidatus Bandiella numerosa TaxID=2570586 RepID=UPI001EFFA28E|nr:UDP-3-O-acyl-N-acetylglucosamine deacetylase [Candidatus Bandiella numerosa]
MDYQQTVCKKDGVSGIGLHTGEIVNLVISPLKEDSGIIFKRSDISKNNIIPAKFFNVTNTKLCTEISNASGIKIATIEHIMAALWGMDIDNALIEVSGPEVPAMDGSSKEFISLIKRAGIKAQSKKRKYLKILDTIKVTDEDKEIVIESANNFAIDFDIEFNHQSIGHQNYSLSDSTKFEDEIGNARTFGFLCDVEFLKKNGLARGASLNNSIGLSETGVVNSEGLRCEDEFVKHKILDCVGDLFLSGYRIIGNIKATKAGHNLNNAMLKKIFDNPDSYKII